MELNEWAKDSRIVKRDLFINQMQNFINKKKRGLRNSSMNFTQFEKVWRTETSSGIH